MASTFAELRLHDPRVLGGPNPWGPPRVVVCELPHSAIARPLADHEAHRIREAALAASGAGEVEHGAQARLSSAADIPTLIAEVALVVQRAAGAEVSFTSVREDARGACSRVVLEYTVHEAAFLALAAALRIVQGATGGEAVDPKVEVAAVRRALANGLEDPLTEAVLAAAERRSIPTRRLGGRGFVQLGQGCRAKWLRGVTGDWTSAAGVELSRDVATLQHLLLAAGVPTPLRVRVESHPEAVRLGRELGYPLAVHRAAEGGEIRPLGPAPNEAALLAALEEAEDGPVELARPEVGAEHRFLVAFDRVRSVLRVKDEGGDPESIGEIACHPHTLAAAITAARLAHLPVAEVAVRSPDPRLPLTANGGSVLGVDPAPDLAPHVAADPSLAHVIAEGLLGLAYPPGASARVPVVAVTGTNGKTTTSRLIAHLLGRRLTVGLKTTDGVSVGERELFRGDVVSAVAAHSLFADPAVEAAVLECAHGGILRFGLGAWECDVGVVLNVGTDHLGAHGVWTLEDLAAVKGVVAKAVAPGGAAVLNADDARVHGMGRACRGEVFLFSRGDAEGQRRVEEHVAAGGRAVVLTDGAYVLRSSQGRAEVVARTADVPLAFGGHAGVLHENVLAAIAAAVSLGQPLRAIREGLGSFTSSAELNPGRMNLFGGAGVSVLVDYAHNPPSVAALSAVARSFGARRALLVIGVPGDRRDEDIRECGRLAALFDHVVVRERDRPGPRPPGEVARLLVEGLVSAGRRPPDVEVLLSEEEAVLRVLELAEPGDLVVLLANDVEAVVGTVRWALDAWSGGEVDAAAAHAATP